MLKGVRIVEVEGLGPGPFCAMALADLGADVIKIARPADDAKLLGEASLLDRGKRSIVLNLKEAEDVKIFNALIAKADGLIEGFRPGVMERLGVGPQECHAINPRLVYGRMTGWGQEGPLAKVAGHDMNYAALSGALHYASMPGQPPFTPPTLQGDIGGGALYLAIGLLAGILKARETGEGCVVDAAIVDGAAHMMALFMALHQRGQASMQRGSSLLDGPHWSRTYRTSDGFYMSVQALEPHFYALFLEKLDLTSDEDFQHQYNPKHWPALAHRLEVIFANETRQHWCDIFNGSDACVAPVLNPQEASEHPHMAKRGSWVEHNGDLQPRAAPRFSLKPDWQVQKSPTIDEHREEILQEINIITNN